MSRFALLLRCLAPIFFGAGVMHLCLGVGAEVLLGTALPAEAVHSAGLDSQNRFYGVSFTIYGVLLLLAAADLPRYVVMLRMALLIIFAAGAARLIAVALYGWPSMQILALMVLELLLPLPMVLWLNRLQRAAWQPR